MNFQTALVTGASGFIGNALIERLRSVGCRIFALARHPVDIGSDVHWLPVDIRRPEEVRSILAGVTFDVAFHLAGMGVSTDDRDPTAMFNTNAAATGILVESCARTGARAFVYAGSCSEYAPSKAARQLDENSPLTKENLYGVSKVAGGMWGSALARQHGLSFLWLRIFGTYGPGEASYRLIPYLASRLRHGESVDLTPGAQLRDLTYIDDVIEALILGAESAMNGYEGPANVCSGRATAIREVASMVAELMKKPKDLLRFGARPYRADEPLWLVGNPSEFSQRTGFTPRIPLEQGLVATLDRLQFLE